jgi:2-dehydro-3-deoxy-D-arabinonate dehydratase
MQPQEDRSGEGRARDLGPGPGVVVVDGDGGPRLAIWDGAVLRDGSALGRSFDDVARLSPDALDGALDAAWTAPRLPPGLGLRAPVAHQEVWAAGVTYRRSEEARMEESTTADVYARVYSASRPELFFKAAGWRAVGPGGSIGIRADSAWNVPEPELALLVSSSGTILAFACANDVSSRSIEGENPLYLPQAKVYDQSLALGPIAVPASRVDPAALVIRLRVLRGSTVVVEGETRASDIVRPLASLVEHLRRAYALPDGAWLSTGTGIVPPSDFTLEPGDVVEVAIDGLGVLRNRVVRVGSAGPG